VSAFQEWAKEFDQAVWSKNDLNYCKLAWDRATALAEAKLKAEYMEGYEVGITRGTNKHITDALQGGYDGSCDE
jgi:hypothetical protein